MADSNSLILLSPRPTAQPPQDPRAANSPKPSGTPGDETFKNKLEKAKKQKVHSAVKKHIAPPVVKPAAVKSPVAEKPTTEVTDQSAVPQDPAKKPEKPVLTPEEEPMVAEEKAQTKQPDAQTLPVAEDAVEHLVEKKPVKVSKPVAGKTADPVVEAPKVAAVIQTPTNAPETLTKAVSTETKAVAKPAAVDDGDSDIDGNGPDATVTAGKASEFGTGKVVRLVKEDGKNSSDGESSTGGTSQDAAAAAASAGAIPVPGFVDIAPSPDVPAVKLGAHSESSVADISSAAGGLVSSHTGTAATNIAGKAGPVVTPQARFVEDNQPKIISSIQGQLLPHGGTIQLRLDPPELGALSVTVHMRDGVMTASFETSNSDATKMLSHSLGQLKAGLEAAGVSVDKIHVEQGSKHDAPGDGNADGKQGPQEQQRQAQQDQQRREMVQRMWRKLAGGDPLDLVA